MLLDNIEDDDLAYDLEIAINKGNAAGLLGLQGFSEKQQQQNQYINSRMFYQTVRVYFE